MGRMNEMPANFISVKGKIVYLALASLLGLVSSLENPLAYGGVYTAAILFLYKRKNATVRTIFLLTAFFLIFFAAGHLEEKSLTTGFKGNEKTFILKFTNEMKVDGDVLLAYPQTLDSGEKVAISYKIKSEEEKQDIKEKILPGIACAASGTLEIPSVARNPNSFDYQYFLSKKQISWSIKVKKLNIDGCKDPSVTLLSLLQRFRQQEIDKIEESFPSETAALAAALIFGERRLFETGTERSYQKIGIIHLLAISGLHVALIAGVVGLFMLRMDISREKTELVMLLFLPMFAILTGLAPPVNRTVAMMMILIIVRRLHLELTTLDAISLAFMLMLIIQPLLIYDIGFQLSFSVSFSLVISAQKILASFSSILAQTAAVSFIAQLTSLPIILSAFYEISVISILANLLFVPLFSFIFLPMAMIAYLFYSLTHFSILTSILPYMEMFVHSVNQLSGWLASLPGSLLITGKPGIIMTVAFLIMMILFIRKWEQPHTKWIFLLPLIPLGVQAAIPYMNPYGKIIFIDVGQGDSILVKQPFNTGNYLIDTGGALGFPQEEWQERKKIFDPGRDIVLPLLKSEGITHLDKLILTHGDVDHIGGSLSLFDELKVKQLILPGLTERSSLEKESLAKANEEGSKIHYGSAGDAWRTKDGDFMILNPASRSDDRNENSLVLLADLGGKKWLFTGDLGVDGEEALLRKYGGMEIDVLKIGHHGSRSSSSEEFLGMLKPEFAIISAGAANRYGHPHEEVLARLADRSVKVFRTDKNGAIIYRFKRKSGTFSTQIP